MAWVSVFSNQILNKSLVVDVVFIHPSCSSHSSFICLIPGKGEESYPDLLALLIAMVVTVIVGFGVKNSVSLNNVLNVVNLVVWVFMVLAGLFFLSGANWEDGRFLPYGWSGVRMLTVCECKCIILFVLIECGV